jgi:hypothetical protein
MTHKPPVNGPKVKALWNVTWSRLKSKLSKAVLEMMIKALVNFYFLSGHARLSKVEAK